MCKFWEVQITREIMYVQRDIGARSCNHFCSGKAVIITYRGADKSFARRTSRCILFDGENISFDASPVIFIHKQYEYSSNYDNK
jgi:hypothetical protein